MKKSKNPLKSHPSGPTLSSDRSLLAGFGVETITPDRPLPLAGLGDDRIGEETLDDLQVRAVYSADGNSEIVLISLDALYVSRSFCARLESWLETTHSIPADHLFVAATHTHCAPIVIDSGFAGIAADPKYLEEVEAKSRSAINAAISEKFEAAVEFSTAHAPVSINRRARRLDRSGLRNLRLHRPIANRPNSRGPVDNTVRALWFRAQSAADGDIVLIGTGCHPSVLRGNVYSADFPAHIEGPLNALHDRPVRTVFLQGFSGNSRARLLEAAEFGIWPPGKLFDWVFDHSRFRKNSADSDAAWIGKSIATAIAEAPRTQITDIALSAGVSELQLPLEGQPGPKDQQKDIPFRVRSWAVSNSVRLLGLEGEVFSEFGLWLLVRDRSEKGMTMPVGCVGGFAGYIPTASSLVEGGYEIDRSRPLFDLPSRFAQDMEGILKAGITKHLNGAP